MGLITLVSRALGSMYSWDVLLQQSQQTTLLALVVIENQSLLGKKNTTSLSKLLEPNV